jgi:tRNA threonylcarbamoyladenosine biosynthesis protein TsaB
MTLILHLETSTKACSVALSRDGSIVALKESLSDEFSHSENLTVFIQTVIKEAGIELKDLSAISVASGPGSYTGLRIGVSTAKGLCYSLGKPLIAIDSLIPLLCLCCFHTLFLIFSIIQTCKFIKQLCMPSKNVCLF